MNKLLYVILILVAGLFTGSAMAGGDVAAGEAMAASDCAGCHGDAGEGMDDAPKLAGLDHAEHAAMLKGYRDGSREGDMMQMFVSELSDEDIENLAAFYASLGQ